ncbi:hypothetical protein MIND_00364500 [Mycena indigotica]|uniref:deoxyribose-phosphate aldolase n=1 Tax=Mycena indigotica TaxID=2126181 RepID=A0A8H6T3Z6_9AGAR|nr:uncharacterized protein MIND_00364500 [Mycena indigotica]KAF7309922.1 hypothetical protein MIND_00364500 [Mycena indigotica]
MTTTNDWTVRVQAKIAQVLAEEDFIVPETQFSSITEPNATFALAIDHTLLKPDATQEQIASLCDQAIMNKFKSCCVNGANVSQVAERLQGSGVLTCAVIGFPLGAGTSASKAFEAADAVKCGAQEIDMVINIGALKAGQYESVFNDIFAVVVSANVPVKVIIETVFLTDQEKVAACFIAAEAGAAFVKTCTGFSGGGASKEDVLLMRKSVAYKANVKVKASAGIRSFDKCLEMFAAGAERIGTSSGAAIMQSVEASSATY